MNNAEPRLPESSLNGLLQRAARFGMLAFVVGGAGCAYGYSAEREVFYAAYLTAFYYWLNIALGCLGVAMLHGLTGGGWGRTIRRVLEAGYQTLPLLALLFAPIWLNVANIYEWADPEFVLHHEVLQRKAAYLNISGYQTRAIACFVAWVLVGLWLNRYAPNTEPDDDSPRSRMLQLASGMGFIIYGLTLTVAAVDWVMSLEPEWYSTMYGVVYLGGQAVSGLSFALLVVIMLHAREPWSRTLVPDRCSDLGNLLMAFVMFWAYVSFMQFLIIWCGNLPEENVWYLHRSQGSWQLLVAALMGLHFAVPFLLLLSRDMKRQVWRLRWIVVLLLALRYVDMFWHITPGFQHGEAAGQGPHVSWLHVAAWLAIGGIWTAVFCWRLSARAAAPLYDPNPMEIGNEHAHRTVGA